MVLERILKFILCSRDRVDLRGSYHLILSFVCRTDGFHKYFNTSVIYATNTTFRTNTKSIIIF